MAVAAIAALSSCTNDDIVSNENGNGDNNANAPVFTATIEGEGTRTALAALVTHTCCQNWNYQVSRGRIQHFRITLRYQKNYAR